MGYQMEKVLGKAFRSKSENFNGKVRIFGSWYDYKVTDGVPEVGAMLEVYDFTSTELLVRVNNYLFESDVNFIE